MVKKSAFQIVYHRAGCIECGACAKLVPDFWKMNPEDNKAVLIGGTDIKSQNGVIMKQTLDVDGIEPHWVAFECCPIKVIKLYDKQTNQLVPLRKEFNKK
ncbi:MAG TPA: ferredoxin [Candidatus Nanoarchaeia archaeon]|nr:ferredoxin [Candidatus Nanoarchaeia archaeon]